MNQANVWLVEGDVVDFIFDHDSDIDVREYVFETLGIDAVRGLVEAANQRPVNADSQLLLVRAHSITLEAQNALLKILEDTPETTVISLVLPLDTRLLETVRSRVQVHEVKKEATTEAFESFLKLDVGARIAQIEQKLKAKDNEWVRSIKRGLLHYLKSNQVPDLQAVEFVVSRLLTRGASNKMLLEHLALSL